MSSEQDAITLEQLRAAMLAGGRSISDHRDVLSALDAAAGDGDLGATLGAGFEYVQAALDQDPGGDVGALFKTAGLTLARKAPSTIGALLGAAFMRLGAEFQDVCELSASDVVRLMDTLQQAVTERGGATPGQRTIVDALDCATNAARRAATDHQAPAQIFVAAAQGAATAAERTAEMKPQYGRAAWVAERAQGNRDAGAVAWAIYLQGLSAAV